MTNPPNSYVTSKTDVNAPGLDSGQWRRRRWRIFRLEETGLIPQICGITRQVCKFPNPKPPQSFQKPEGDGGVEDGEHAEWWRPISVRKFADRYAASFPIRSRRNLSKSQKAMAASKMANMNHGGNRKNQDANLRLEVTREQAAEMFEVSERSVQTAAMIEREAPAEVAQAVLDGAMSLNLDDLIAEANDAADWLALAAALELDDLIALEACLDDTRIACTDFERSDAGA